MVRRPKRKISSAKRLRAFGDLLAELDMYTLIRSRVLSRGRYGRTREITIDASDDVVDKLYAAVQINFDLSR